MGIHKPRTGRCILTECRTPIRCRFLQGGIRLCYRQHLVEIGRVPVWLLHKGGYRRVALDDIGPAPRKPFLQSTRVAG